LVVAILAQSVSAGEDPLRCSKCDSDNPEGAKFCIDCAEPLATRCPKCGQENLPRAKFCADCATPLIAAAPKSKVQPESTSSRVLPEEAVANEADGERKTVTALFADIKGSTELMVELDPEAARAIIDPALKLMIEAVGRYDGYVVQSTGDGIFALFGAPPRTRTIRSGHSMRRCACKMNCAVTRPRWWPKTVSRSSAASVLTPGKL
jgi:Double zinc ribbon/Adenylate and Guanylate cyclase catalytic domain